MLISPARYAPSRRLARRRLVALARAAALGGVALSVLATTPSAQPTTSEPAQRTSQSRSSVLDSPRSDARRQWRSGPPVINPFGLSRIIGPASQGKPAVGDLDGDGDLDVLAGEAAGSLVYYENTAGAGAPPSFAAPVANPFGLADVGSGSAPAIADLDGDGDLDVLSGKAFGVKQFAYFENTAGPGMVPAFGPPQLDPFGLDGSGSRSTPSVADLDGDGDLDVLASDAGGDLSYWENTAGPNATPAFAPVQTNPFGLQRLSIYGAPSVADLDGDGDLDVLGSDTFGALDFFENTAGPGALPAFAAPVVNPFGLVDIGSRVAPSAVDLDGDGDVDVLAGDSGAQLTLFENKARPGAPPAFAEPVANPFQLSDVPTPSLRPSPSIADLDGDGDLDVLAGESKGGFVLFENTAGPGALPAFAAPRLNAFGLSVPGILTNPSVADLDGDGDLDVLAGESQGRFFYFENGAGPGVPPAFGPAVSNPFGLATVDGNSTPSLADLDGDGDLDVLSGERYSDLLFFLNTAGPGATPAFADSRRNPFGLVGDPTSLNTFYANPAVADLDGDSDLDVLVGTADTDFIVNKNISRPASRPQFTVQPASAYGLQNVGLPAAPAIADLDGDGVLDVLVGIGAGNFYFFSGVGAPAGTAPAHTADALQTEELSLTAVTPNPARGGARLTVTVPEPERVRVIVTDALGREVARLHDGELSGSAELMLDTSRLAPGVYVVRVEGDTATEVQRLTVVR